MERRELGRTGLLITPICIGTVAVGDLPDVIGFSVSSEQAHAVIKKVFDSPINFLDTSSNYGEAEKRIGWAIKERGGLPGGFVLQTKVDRDSATGDFSGDQIKRSLDRSLELLGLQYLPVVYIHDPEHTTFENIMGKNGAFEILQKAKAEGVIGHIGISGGPISMLIKYVETGEFEAVITHNRFNLLHRAAESLLDVAGNMGVAVLNAAPFGSGILADEQKHLFAYQPASQDILERVRQMRRLCGEYGISLKAAALQFSFRDERVSSTIVGASEPQHIEEYISLLTVDIPTELYQKISEYAIYQGDPEAGRFKTRVYSD